MGVGVVVVAAAAAVAVVAALRLTVKLHTGIATIAILFAFNNCV
jgi:hypothetical protein